MVGIGGGSLVMHQTSGAEVPEFTSLEFCTYGLPQGVFQGYPRLTVINPNQICIVPFGTLFSITVFKH